MPYLKSILMTASDKSSRMLRAKSMECISLVGMAVGKEKFRDDAKQVSDFFVYACAGEFLSSLLRPLPPPPQFLYTTLTLLLYFLIPHFTCLHLLVKKKKEMKTRVKGERTVKNRLTYHENVLMMSRFIQWKDFENISLSHCPRSIL